MNCMTCFTESHPFLLLCSPQSICILSAVFLYSSRASLMELCSTLKKSLMRLMQKSSFRAAIEEITCMIKILIMQMCFGFQQAYAFS